MTNKSSINNSNKSRNIELIECKYNGPNKPGDFKFEIKEELKKPIDKGQGTLWLFNDNHQHRKKSNKGGGNAVIRPYNKYGKYKSNPLSAGITTGTYGTLLKSGKGYESLGDVIQSDGRSARKNIDEDMENIKILLKTGNYNKVKIITDENGLIGNKIFKIDIEVKLYIKDKLNKVIDELNNSSSLQKKFNHIKKFNVMNNIKIPRPFRASPSIQTKLVPNQFLTSPSIKKKKTTFFKKLTKGLQKRFSRKKEKSQRKKNIYESPQKSAKKVNKKIYKIPPTSISNRLLEKNLKPKQILSNNSSVRNLLNNSESIKGRIVILPNVGKKKKNQQKNKSTKNKPTKNKPTKKKKN